MSPPNDAPVDSTKLLLSSVRERPIFESRDEKLLMATQLEVTLDRFYVHLPLKESMLGVRLAQQARLLRANVDFYPDDLSFMAAVIQLSTGIRDPHTRMVLPEPWSALRAYLPFLIEEYFDDAGKPRYIVTKLPPAMDLGEDFVPGVEVTHWNGEPMHSRIQRLGRSMSGANYAARFRAALQALTTRTLAYDLPPEEDFVMLSYLGKKGPAVLTHPWLVTDSLIPFELQPEPQSRSATALGMNAQAMQVQRLKKMLFVPDRLRRELEIAAGREHEADSAETLIGGTAADETVFPESLSFRVAETQSGKFGYLRIWNFMVGDEVEAFVMEAERIIRLLPRNGLIIDVRGNPGGVVMAGERLLQFFSPNRIEPEPVSLRCTEFVRLLAERYDWLEPWRRSLNLGVVTGELFSQGIPLTSVDEANSVGRIYTGPVVLICDAESYSACDFFVAGFKDHGLGKIIGTDRQTGAGGANVWNHELLVEAGIEGSGLKYLARGASMNVAMRRSTRVGAMRGIPVEGLGVEVDVHHRYTRDDILHQNVDLLNRAGQLIASGA
ncbi:MAG: S41 family peptidase [Hyalangium sp.]|uniref:S41 family peptidase n=1 Tax=Hyalangium sp. TaxID=2028555 RepID=UPI00389B1FFA